MRLKPQYDGLLTNFAFNFNLRRYSVECVDRWVHFGGTNAISIQAGRVFTTTTRPTLNLLLILMGAKAEAWCLLIHADASRSLYPPPPPRVREGYAFACIRRHQAFALASVHPPHVCMRIHPEGKACSDLSPSA